MRRVVFGLVLSALLCLAPLAPATAAPSTARDQDVLLLATEAGGGEPLPGRTPREPDSPDNPNPPREYEENFLWGAGVGLAVLVIGLVLLIGGLYYLLVQRPRTKADSRS